MAAPVVFASQRKRKDSLFGDDNDMTVAPNLGFGADMLSQFPVAARKAMPKDARDMMLNPLGGLSGSLAGLGISGLGHGDDKDCGNCGRSRCPFCRVVGLPSNALAPTVFKSGPPGLSTRPSLRDPTMKRLDGPVEPSASYLRRVAVPSRFVRGGVMRPLLVLSLDGVVDCRLPYHLNGGYTNVLKRPYLDTFLRYVLNLQSPWAICVYTSLDKETAMETLRQLRGPTGGPEKDERDGVVGVFARDDMRQGWNGGELEVKDLEVLWAGLKREENIQWGIENTVVITDYPGHYKLQPANFVLAPSMKYISDQRAADDNFLLLMIAVLRDLETESNFAYHIHESKYNTLDFWTSEQPDKVNERNAYLADAVSICADKRITIRALGGNLYL